MSFRNSYCIRHACSEYRPTRYICIRVRTVKVGHFLSRYILLFPVDMPINHLVRQALFSYFIRHALQPLFVLLFFPKNAY